MKSSRFIKRLDEGSDRPGLVLPAMSNLDLLAYALVLVVVAAVGAVLVFSVYASIREVVLVGAVFSLLVLVVPGF